MTMDRQTLDVRIRQLTALEPDPNVVAEKLLGEASAAEKREISALLLPGYVRQIMTEGHRHLSRPADRPRRGRTPGVFTAQDGRKFASARQRDLADWETITGASLAGPDGRKFFGEFTTQEVRWLTKRRQDQAQALLDQATRYASVAAAMVEHEVERVKDLPPGLLVDLMHAPAQEPESAQVE
jgi:hypothetical protein